MKNCNYGYPSYLSSTKYVITPKTKHKKTVTRNNENFLQVIFVPLGAYNKWVNLQSIKMFSKAEQMWENIKFSLL